MVDSQGNPLRITTQYMPDTVKMVAKEVKSALPPGDGYSAQWRAYGTGYGMWIDSRLIVLTGPRRDHVGRGRSRVVELKRVCAEHLRGGEY
jgi:hypothetical protein